jgi:hypothetical protein
MSIKIIAIFQAVSFVPLYLVTVLSKLNVQLRTPAPPAVPEVGLGKQ